MNWSSKIRLFSILLVFLTALGISAKAGNTASCKSLHQQIVTSSGHHLQPATLLFINAPLPEKPEELLFIEETEDEQHSWILSKSNRIFYICISALFGEPDQDMQLIFQPDTAEFPLSQLSTIGRLSRLQTFRI